MTTPPADPQALSIDDAPGPADPGRRGFRRRAPTAILPAALLAVALAVTAAAGSRAQPSGKPAQPPTQAPAPQPTAAKPGAPQVQPPQPKYTNLKLLGNVQPDLGKIMHLMNAALGVQCDYCHVIDVQGEHFELDTKPAKLAARDMLLLVRKINQDSFAGEPVVSCETCHHGRIHPPRAPAVVPAPTHSLVLAPGEHPLGPSERAIANLPSTAEVLDRYLEALGGRAALEAVRSRVSRGTLLRVGIVNAGTPKAHAVSRAQVNPLEIVQSLPDKIVVTWGPPEAQVVQTFDSTSGTVKMPQGSFEMEPKEAARLAARYELRRELKLRDHADALRVIGRETIDGREMFVLETTGPDGQPIHLFFDTQTGLLRRQIFYMPTLIGLYPEQLDYDDYREVDGVKVPFFVNYSPLDDFHFGFTRKLTEIRNNVE